MGWPSNIISAMLKASERHAANVSMNPDRKRQAGVSSYGSSKAGTTVCGGAEFYVLISLAAAGHWTPRSTASGRRYRHRADAAGPALLTCASTTWAL